MVAAILLDERTNRQEQLDGTRHSERRRRDADDRPWLAVDRQGATDDLRVGREDTLPESIGHDDDSRAGLVLFWEEATPEGDVEAQDRQNVRGQELRVDVFQLPLVLHIDIPVRQDTEGLPTRAALLPVAVVHVPDGELRDAACGIGFVDPHQA